MHMPAGPTITLPGGWAPFILFYFIFKFIFINLFINLLIYLFIVFLRLHLQYMEVPRLGVESEL